MINLQQYIILDAVPSTYQPRVAINYQVFDKIICVCYFGSKYVRYVFMNNVKYTPAMDRIIFMTNTIQQKYKEYITYKSV